MSPPTRRSRPAGNGPADVVVAGRPGDNARVPLWADEIPLFRAVLPTGDITQAAVARDAAIAVVERASDAQDKAVVDQAIRVRGEMYGEVNANHIRPLLPNVRSSLIGARFLALARQGRLKKVGFVKATHPAGHGRWIAQWRWVDDQ